MALSSGAASAAAFKKGPYLQALDATGVTVKFELDELEKATLEVFPAGQSSPAITRASKETHRFHTLRVDGLSPATAYDYRVSAGDAKSETGHFTTAPSDNRPFRFVVYGDSRSDHTAHAAVVRAIMGTAGDFLINSGDLVADGGVASDWQTFFDIEGKLLRDRCVFSSVGNHEVKNQVVAVAKPDEAIAFLRYFGGPMEEGGEVKRLYGSFRWSNSRFFLLNAMDAWTGEEREWLRAELDRALDEPGLVHRFAVLHQGPFSSGPHGGNRALVDGGVVEIMRDRKVDLIFAGHDHAYERGAGQGLKYIISGGAGAPLYPKQEQAPQTITFESVHHFVEVEVDGDRVALTARRASGSVIERCGFRGAGGWDCDAVKPAKSAESAKPAGSGAQGTIPPTVPQRAGPSSCGCGAAGAPGPGAGLAATLAVAAAWRARKRARGADGTRAA